MNYIRIIYHCHSYNVALRKELSGKVFHNLFLSLPTLNEQTRQNKTFVLNNYNSLSRNAFIKLLT